LIGRGNSAALKSQRFSIAFQSLSFVIEKDVTLIRKTILMHLESLRALPATDNKIHIYGLSS